MIDEQKIAGMLQAKALGCLDSEDDKEMQDFINEGHQFPWDELGKFQNVASILPMALNLELPNPELKDRVALKLIKLSEQLRTNKILEEDKFEAEEDNEENADVFTNIEEAVVEPSIEIESEETVIEDNLVASLNQENNSFNLDEITLPDFESGEVSDENAGEKIEIDTPDETLIIETEIAYPHVEEMAIENVMTENETQPFEKTPPKDISIKQAVSETNIIKDTFNNLKTEQSERIEDSNDQTDLTKRSVVDKMFKAIEQDFDSLKFHFDESERKITRGLLIAYVLISVLLALLIFSFFKFSADIKNLENEIKELKNKSTSSLYKEIPTNPDQYLFS